MALTTFGTPIRSEQLPLKINKAAGDTLQIQIYHQIQQLILNGHLRPGTVVPSLRELSEQLQVSKNTVILAYEKLVCEGYLMTQAGVGTYVSPLLPEQALHISRDISKKREKEEQLALRHPLLFHGRIHGIFSNRTQRPQIDFFVGRPDADTFPTRIWKRILEKKIDHGHTGMTEYSDPAGLLELREAIANHLGPARGIDVSADQIIIVGGIQEALNLISRLLVAPGTSVAIESPCYQGAAFVFKEARAEIIPVPADEAGIDVGQLPCTPAGVIYVTPSHQYPLGGTLSLDRRLMLLDWAWRTGAYIIEDDYDSDFRYFGSPLFALAGLDRHESVIYLGTFSKSIGAGIRTGYIVAPTALAEPLTTLKGLLNNGNPWLVQAVLAEFISSGEFNKHLRKIRQIYLHRQEVLIESLRKHFGEVEVSGTEGGMHIIWTLPPDIMAASELRERALRAGVGIYPLGSGAASFIANDRQRDRMVMLGFSSVCESDIRKGVEILAKIARSND